MAADFILDTVAVCFAVFFMTAPLSQHLDILSWFQVKGKIPLGYGYVWIHFSKFRIFLREGSTSMHVAHPILTLQDLVRLGKLQSDVGWPAAGCGCCCCCCCCCCCFLMFFLLLSPTARNYWLICAPEVPNVVEWIDCVVLVVTVISAFSLLWPSKKTISNMYHAMDC